MCFNFGMIPITTRGDWSFKTGEERSSGGEVFFLGHLIGTKAKQKAWSVGFQMEFFGCAHWVINKTGFLTRTFMVTRFCKIKKKRSESFVVEESKRTRIESSVCRKLTW